jgi:hypothetical protein
LGPLPNTVARPSKARERPQKLPEPPRLQSGFRHGALGTQQKDIKGDYEG